MCKIKRLCIFFVFMFSNLAVAENWSYVGHAGPEHWGQLDKRFAICNLGKEQSPIDISTKNIEKKKIDPIKTLYQASVGELVNTGHTIQLNLTDAGHITLPSGEYKFMQFHLHTPSEEKIDKKRFPIVFHLVHQNSAGNLAVIAVLARQGKENPALQEIFAHLPTEAGKMPLKRKFDLNAILPSSLSAYSFEGSLTTPPCSEGVEWYVLKKPIELSKAQIHAFRKIFKMNARPIQSTNGRKVFETRE